MGCADCLEQAHRERIASRIVSDAATRLWRELGRRPDVDEIARAVPPGVHELVGLPVPGPLDELEAVLVPCGC